MKGPPAGYDFTRRIFRDKERASHQLGRARLRCKALHPAATRAFYGRCVTKVQQVYESTVQLLSEFEAGRGSLLFIAPDVKRIRFEPGDTTGLFADETRSSRDGDALQTLIRTLPLMTAVCRHLRCLWLDSSELGWTHFQG